MITSPSPLSRSFTSSSSSYTPEDLSTLSAFQSSIDRSKSTVQLLCEVPIWSPAFPDMAECSSLRSRALGTLHCICQDLKDQGLTPRYSLVPSTSSYSTIRISPPASSSSSAAPPPLSPSSPLSPRRRGGSIPTVEELAELAHGEGEGSTRRRRTMLLPARKGEEGGVTLVLV